MHAEIVSIGTELLMGEIVDTNSAFLASELPKLGIELRWVSKVSDNPDHMAEVLGRAWGRSDLTLMTGGLGPTSDDLTRETIAQVLGEEMYVNDDLLRYLKAQFASYGIPMPENNIKQATLIPSASTVANPIGTAPGWWVERDGKIAVAMPGPPRELKRMWANEVAPRLREKNRSIVMVTKTWKTFGISEGGLNEMLAPLFVSKNPSMGIYARPDGIHLRALATVRTRDEGLALIEPLDVEIRNVTGQALWGVDDETPESLLASKLAANGMSLAAMESHTNGLLASTLAGAPGSSEWLRGGIVALGRSGLSPHGVPENVLRSHGPASAQTAEAMARAARERLHADVGISITPVASDGEGDDPVQRCAIGFDVRGRASHMELRYPSRLMMLRERTVAQALLGLLKQLG